MSHRASSLIYYPTPWRDRWYSCCCHSWKWSGGCCWSLGSVHHYVCGGLSGKQSYREGEELNLFSVVIRTHKKTSQRFLSCSRRAVWVSAHRQLHRFALTTQWQLQPWTLVKGSFQELQFDFSRQRLSSDPSSESERHGCSPELRAERLKWKEICWTFCSEHTLSPHIDSTGTVNDTFCSLKPTCDQSCN